MSRLDTVYKTYRQLSDLFESPYGDTLELITYTDGSGKLERIVFNVLNPNSIPKREELLTFKTLSEAARKMQELYDSIYSPPVEQEKESPAV